MNTTEQGERVLVVAMSGIGNLLMATPMLRALRMTRPRTEISVLVAPRGTAEILERNEDVALLLRGSPKPSLREWLGMVRTAQQQGYGIGIITYPGQLVMSASLLSFGRIGKRIGHRYSWHVLRKSGVFLSDALPVRDVHDVAQNLQLLEPLGIRVDAEAARYSFPLAPEDMAAADAFRAEHRLTEHTLIGIHPGAHRDMDYKRWPEERWIELGTLLAEKDNAYILVFGGPDERTLKEQIVAGIGAHRAQSVDLPLRATAGLIRHCRLFVSNDSGLMHVAVSQEVPTFGLFGPTNERRTAPWGPYGHVIRATGTEPTYDVRQLKKIRQRHEPDASLRALTVQDVVRHIAMTTVTPRLS